jgi:hypothetical protein
MLSDEQDGRMAAVQQGQLVNVGAATVQSMMKRREVFTLYRCRAITLETP